MYQLREEDMLSYFPGNVMLIYLGSLNLKP